MKGIILLNIGIIVTGVGDSLNNPDIIGLGISIMLLGLLATMACMAIEEKEFNKFLDKLS